MNSNYVGSWHPCAPQSFAYSHKYIKEKKKILTSGARPFPKQEMKAN